jgi:hypothetical protein
MERLHVAKRERLIAPSSAIDPRALQDLRSLGIYPSIEGGAQGYNQIGDIVTQTSDGRDLNEIWAAFRAALAMYNSQRDRLLSNLVFPVSQVIEDVYQGGNTVDFEEASEFGVPVGVRAELPAYFSLAYSFKWWDIGMRFTWKFLAENNADQVDALNNMILEADNRNQFREVFKQVFNDSTRTATITGNNYNVFPIYNGDSTVPPAYKNTIHTAPHTHFLVSGGATVVSDDLEDMEAHLKHHGYGWQNGSALILLVNSAQMNTIRGFSTDGGDLYDFIAAAGVPAWAWTTMDIAASQERPGAAPPSSFRGLPIEGRYGPWLIVEEDLIPAGYMLGFASGGEENAANLVGVREHANASLRGLRLVKGQRPDYPLVDSYYQRGFGTGIRQRGAGVVMFIDAGASYTVPSGYEW